MSGENDGQCTEAQFLAGCNRFGLDNPIPIITKRLWLYGNHETCEKEIKELAKLANNKNVLDPERLGM